MEHGVARAVATSGRLLARHRHRRLRDGPRYVRAPAGGTLVGSARAAGPPLARGASGQVQRPLACVITKQKPRSRNGTLEVHGRRRHGLCGAGADRDTLTPQVRERESGGLYLAPYWHDAEVVTNASSS